MSSPNDDLQRDPELKRKAWVAAFLVSALFWGGLLLLVWKFWG
ncbi:YmiA family putative membrane protein [Jejubacter calystegiae]|jgi:hypothetical protein|nr:YmiA family putative membrane protein [Jejubacter calystegiae]